MNYLGCVLHPIFPLLPLGGRYLMKFTPSAWRLGFFAKILDFFFISCQDLGFLRFLAKILAINLAKKSKKSQDLAKKSKIMS